MTTPDAQRELAHMLLATLDADPAVRGAGERGLEVGASAPGVCCGLPAP